MKESIGKAVSLAFGLAVLGKEQVEKAVGEWVKRGDVTREEANVWIDAAAAKGKEFEMKAEKAAKDRIEALLKEQGFASQEEVDRLAKRIEALEQQLKPQ
mgnify:CR=1 FL=1